MKIFELEIQPLVYNDFFQEITKDIVEKKKSSRVKEWQKGKIVFTPNPEILLQARQDREFFDFLSKADFLTNDGIGLYVGYQIQDGLKHRKKLHPKTSLAVWERCFILWHLPYYFFNLLFRKKYLYRKYGDRICGSDLTLKLTEFAQEKSIQITIIDLYNPSDTAKVANQKIFSEKLQAYFPQLQFDYFVYDPENREEILEHITQSDSQIVFSTLGMKKQEKSILKIVSECPNIKLGLGVGSSFDYITGFQKRAPEVFQKLWLEWFYRIFTSPGKIRRIKRIFQAVFVFPIMVTFSKK